jgi:DNA primase
MTQPAHHDPRFDFSRLKAQVSIDQALAAYGANRGLIRRGHQLIGPCPVHGGDNPTAFRAHLERGIWHCWTSCGGGDIVDLVRAIERCSFAEAARKLAAIAQRCPAPSPVQPAADKPDFRPFTYRIPLDPRCSLLQDRKRITLETARLFDAGTTLRSRFLRGTVAVRLHDPAGRPLGYCGRRLDPAEVQRWGKWRFPSSFPKGDVLYNAHRAIRFRSSGIVVAECAWSVMRLHQAGIPAAVALLGASASPAQIAWLSNAAQILVLFDGDDAGWSGARALAGQLSAKVHTIVRDMPPGLDPDDLSDPQLRCLVNGGCAPTTSP